MFLSVSDKHAHTQFRVRASARAHTHTHRANPHTSIHIFPRPHTVSCKKPTCAGCDTSIVCSGCSALVCRDCHKTFGTTCSRASDSIVLRAHLQRAQNQLGSRWEEIGVAKPERLTGAQIMNEALHAALLNARRYRHLEGGSVQDKEIIALTVSDLDKIEGLRLSADSYIRVDHEWHSRWRYFKPIGRTEPDFLRSAPWYLNSAVCALMCARCVYTYWSQRTKDSLAYGQTAAALYAKTCCFCTGHRWSYIQASTGRVQDPPASSTTPRPTPTTRPAMPPPTTTLSFGVS